MMSEKLIHFRDPDNASFKLEGLQSGAFFVVATWNPAASSAYYARRTECYLGDAEPAGVRYAPAGEHCGRRSSRA
jgi:hypothetical protein